MPYLQNAIPIIIFLLVFIAIAGAAYIVFSIFVSGILTGKIAVKDWFKDRKYIFFLFFLVLAYICLFICLMLFGFWGLFAGIPLVTVTTGILIGRILKKRAVFFAEEATSYHCLCGKDISQIISISPKGKRKLEYYICRHCQKRYNKKELGESSGNNNWYY